jgi:hypothetical protein
VQVKILARSVGNAVAKAWRLIHRTFRQRIAQRDLSKQEQREALKRLPQLRSTPEGGWQNIAVAFDGYA